MKKGFFAAFLCALIMVLLPAAVYAMDGTGTEDNPYQISSADDLEEFRDIVNGENGKTRNSSACAILKNDIVLNCNENNQWTPIGSESNRYTGTFDGNGKTVSGIYINTSEDYQGLFGYIGIGGTVKDLGIEKSRIKGGNNVGGIAGYSDGSITNCYNEGSVSGNNSVGGIAGKNEGSASIKDCHNTGSVSGEYEIGGIAGESVGTIEDCYNIGDVSSTSSFVGGIVGSGWKDITNCYNTGRVIGYYSGGIAGHSNGGRIEDCYNTGSVIGYNEGGGIAGYSGGSIEDCYNTGSVSGYDAVGGIAGRASIDNANNKVIKNCYNTGKINDGKGGGIVRYLTAMDGSDLINCYYLEGCGKDNGMGTKKTLEEFASGEVAYLLQSGSDEQVWGQEKDEDFPILTDDEDLRIYKVTFMAEGTEYAVAYGNRDGVRVMPKDPELSGEGFGHWEDEDGDEFTQNSRVKEDMTVTAVEKEKEPEPEKPKKPGSSYSLPEGITKDEEKEPEKEPDTEEKPDDTKTDISVQEFDDVSIFDWYYEGVMYVSENGIMNGVGGNKFEPGTELKREMLATILWNMEGKPEPKDIAPFLDVMSGEYYSKAIAWAGENGIISGYGSEYGVGEAVTREDFAAILYRYAEYKGYDTTQGGMAVREFADYEEISEYAKTPVAWAVNTGIISGMGNGSISPKTTTSRGQAAVMLMNFCKNVK